MRKRIFAISCILIFCSHDLYLKLGSYFLQPNKESQIQLFNGTFDKSENVIDRNRMLDASIFGNGKRVKIKENQWTEKDSITFLNFNSGEQGTYVVGVSTKARNIEMKSAAFNKYLKHDGVKDMLLQRENNNTLDEDAVEKYSKHVKAIFQVGSKKTKDWNTVLGYPIEFVPLENPYQKYTGETISIKLLRNGKPLKNQLVYANYKSSNKQHTHTDNNAHLHSDGKKHSHSTEDENHTHTTGQELRTDNEGLVSVNLTNDGIWYIRTIHLVNSEEEGLTHESNWATLTFEVSHKHGVETHTHADEEGISSYVFWVGSILIIGVLFFIFNKKKQ